MSDNIILIKTNVGCSDTLKAGETYLVAIKSWYSGYEKVTRTSYHMLYELCIDKFDRTVVIYKV
jgi:hypothetical protein